MNNPFQYCPRCTKPLEMAPVDGGPPRQRCPDSACGFVHWDNPVPVVAAIVEHRGQVVLARNRLWGPGMFGLITGFLEKDDPDPATGVLREVEEELGLRGRVEEFVGHYPFERMNQLIIAYHVRAEGEIVLGEELAEYKLVAFDQVQPWPAGTGYALRDWLLRRGIAPQPFTRRHLRFIRNFHAIDERLLTGGQPTAEELTALQACGVECVINLAPQDSPYALANEREKVEALGMRYVNLPVDYEHPTGADFEAFCAEMNAARARCVFVHCILNRRVSAFVFLYRVLSLGVPRAEAEKALRAQWQPDGVWAQFIEQRLAQGAPH
jgi:protein tyrosine phosphatase (PTP) superfamily phosphohydrolase (DUF442 family)